VPHLMKKKERRKKKTNVEVRIDEQITSQRAASVSREVIHDPPDTERSVVGITPEAMSFVVAIKIGELVPVQPKDAR
jgi:hypothetical protein